MLEDSQQHMEKWTRLLVIVSTLLVLAIFVWVIIRIASFLSHTILLFALAGLVAYALDPLVASIRERSGAAFWMRHLRRGGASADVPDKKMSRPAAISIVFLTLFVLIGFGVYALSKPLSHQVRLFSDKGQQAIYHARADAFLKEADLRLGKVGVKSNLDDYLHNPGDIPQSVKTDANNVERQIVPFLRDVVVSAGESVIVLLISLYLLIYSSEMRLKFNAMLPPNLKLHADVWEEDVNRIVGGFIRGQLIIALVMGGAAALGCLALGIHIWLLIGIFVAIASFIPVFGPYIGAVPAIIAALITPTHIGNNVIAAIVILVFFIVINEVGSKILYPRLVGQAIGLHEVLVLFVLFAGLEIGGVIGVLFAAPLTAIILVTLVHLYRFWLDLPDSLLSKRDEPKEPSKLAA